MEIKIYNPLNQLLQKYIECFYTLKHRSEEKATTYLTFPSVFTIVTVSKNTQTTVGAHRLLVKHSTDNIIETNLACNFNQPVLVTYEGATSELVVYFKPLGINAFLPENLCFYNKGEFPNFEPFEDYRQMMTEILAGVGREGEKIRLLENYWLSKFKGFEHPFLVQLVDDLMNENIGSQPIASISTEYGISRTMLNKLFNLYICKTPVQFRKIVRFRCAVKRHLLENSNSDLTGTAHDLKYFDQSHMIKDFRALTGYAPKTFFSQVSKLGNGRINWMFL